MLLAAINALSLFSVPLSSPRRVRYNVSLAIYHGGVCRAVDGNRGRATLVGDRHSVMVIIKSNMRSWNASGRRTKNDGGLSRKQ